MMSNAIGRNWATPAAWDAHRHTITHLYIDEEKTLKEVMSIMQRDYLFFATKKMYKSRIERWDLRKYGSWRTHTEMPCMVQKEASTKPTDCVAHGRKVSHTRADHCLKNKASTVVRAREIGKPKDARHFKRLAPAPRWLSLPDDMKMPDAVTRLVGQFVTGCCEGGRWCPDGTTTPVFVAYPKTLCWLYDVISASELVYQGHLKQGFRFIDACFNQLKEFIRDPDPTLFTYILYTILRVPEDLGKRIFAYIAEMSAIILLANHPLNLIWSSLRHAGTQQVKNHFWTIIRCYWDVLQDRFGQREYGLLNFGRIFYRLALDSEFIDLETARSKQLDIVKDLESLEGCRNEVLHTKLAVADLYFQEAQYETAKACVAEIEEEVHKIIPRAESSIKAEVANEHVGTEPWRRAPTSYHYLYFEIYKATGEVEDAIKAGREYIRSCLSKPDRPRAKSITIIKSVQLYFAEVDNHEEEKRLQQILDAAPNMQNELQAYFRDIDLADALAETKQLGMITNSQ